MIIPHTAKHWHSIAKMMMALSALFVLLGIAAGAYRFYWLQHADKTTGTILELIERQSDDGVSYAPVFVFQDSDRKEHIITSTIASNPPAGRVGEEIPVLFHSDDPESARIDTFFSKWGLSTVAGGLGVFYLLIFWVVALFTGRRMKRNKRIEDHGTEQPPAVDRT